MSSFVSRYRKALIAVAGAVISLLVQVFTDAGWTEIASVLVAVATALGVYRVPNQP